MQVPCRRPSVHSERPIPGKGVAGRAGDGIPSYDGTAPVSEREGAVGHPDATAFLTTRVRLPDKEDWGTVKRVLSNLKGTLHMPLVLSADSLTLSTWWVDVAYAMHDDCRGHTGAGMSFGQGMALSYSWKHKINTKSLTEAELVGVDDVMGYILWACYFMQEQGYDMDPSLLYQDIMSAILLKTNGRASSSKRTKHIKVKYYLIKDKLDWGE